MHCVTLIQKGRDKVKKLLLVLGIVIIVVSILALLFALLNLLGYYRVLDGSAELYGRLHRNMIVFLIVGIVLAAIGAACFVIRSKT